MAILGCQTWGKISVSVPGVYQMGGLIWPVPGGVGHTRDVEVAFTSLWGHGEDLCAKGCANGCAKGCLGWLVLSGLLSLQFTIGSDEDESGSALAPAQFHVEEECGILSPAPRFTDLQPDKSSASLPR